ncbi:MAG: SAM-dependent methyltransferase, partial [Micrococcales bacterium]|nr:SAM-dependent methyltransferase [Micrococcales bacterium]
MEPEALTALLSTQGWTLLQALPPYEERHALRVSQRLHDEGIDPTLVAAVLTQSRLRVKAR